MMSDFRTNPPKSLAGSKVIRMDDLGALKRTNIKTGEVTEIESGKMGMESSNVLQFLLKTGQSLLVDLLALNLKLSFILA